MRIIKITECPYSERLFEGKEWSPLICTFFETALNIEDKEKIPEFCELEIVNP